MQTNSWKYQQIVVIPWRTIALRHSQHKVETIMWSSFLLDGKSELAPSKNETSWLFPIFYNQCIGAVRLLTWVGIQIPCFVYSLSFAVQHGGGHLPEALWCHLAYNLPAKMNRNSIKVYTCRVQHVSLNYWLCESIVLQLFFISVYYVCCRFDNTSLQRHLSTGKIWMLKEPTTKHSIFQMQQVILYYI